MPLIAAVTFLFPPTRTEQGVVSAALASLPASVRRLADENVVEILFAEGLATNGIVRGAGGRAVLVFDRNVLNMSVNDYLSAEEARLFGVLNPADVRIIATRDVDDFPGSAFRFTFLRELGRTLPNVLHGPPRNQLPLRAHDMRSAYRAFQWSEFVTLNSSAAVEDDMADFFAVYVHARMLGQPFFNTWREPSQVGPWNGAHSGINEPAGARKRAFLKALIDPHSGPSLAVIKTALSPESLASSRVTPNHHWLGRRIYPLSNDSPLQAAGFEGGDVIVRINGCAITSTEKLYDVVVAQFSAERLVIDFARHGIGSRLTATAEGSILEPYDYYVGYNDGVATWNDCETCVLSYRQ